jgi:hypothetical protein
MPFSWSVVPRQESIELSIRPAGGDALGSELEPGIRINIVELGSCEFRVSLEAFYPGSILRREP